MLVKLPEINIKQGGRNPFVFLLVRESAEKLTQGKTRDEKRGKNITDQA